LNRKHGNITHGWLSAVTL